MDVDLVYSNNTNHELVRYVDAGYLYDPYKYRSPTCYLFTCYIIVISWISTKKTLVVTSSNHAEILAIYKASWECVWLRSITQYILGSCGFSSSRGTPTILYEDNIASIA